MGHNVEVPLFNASHFSNSPFYFVHWSRLQHIYEWLKTSWALSSIVLARDSRNPYIPVQTAPGPSPHPTKTPKILMIRADALSAYKTGTS